MMFLLNFSSWGNREAFLYNHATNPHHSKRNEPVLSHPACPAGFYLVDVCAVGPVARIARGAGAAAEPGAGVGAGHAGEAGVGEAPVELCDGDDGARGLGVHAWGREGRETRSCRCPSPPRALGLVPVT